MATRVLNRRECGFTDFMTIGSVIYGFGGHRGQQLLHIARVIVVQDATKEEHSLIMRRPIMQWNVDLDIVLEDGTVIEVNTTEERFIRKMMNHVWEIQQKNPRINFYGRKAEQKKGLTEQDRKQLVILTQQLDAERLIKQHLLKERDELTREFSWDDIATQKKQRQCLASEQRILNLQAKINKLHEKEA